MVKEYLGRMGRIHLRLHPLVCYLLALSLYSSLMFLSVINEAENKTRTSDHLDSEEQVIRTRRSTGNGETSWISGVDDFYTRVSRLETKCRKLVRFGGTFCKGYLDNEKYVCLDEDVGLRPNACTVYGFGVGADTTFDDMASYFGCEVFMFDPTINGTELTLTNMKRQYFYQLGLDAKQYKREFQIEYDNKSVEHLIGEFTTYEDIRKRLGHENRDIQYLKLDIENTEWAVLPKMIKQGHLDRVSQLAIEVHTMDIIHADKDKVLPMLQHYWQVLENLKQLGFLRAHHRFNTVMESLYFEKNRTYSTCMEVLYVRRGFNRRKLMKNFLPAPDVSI